LLLRLDRPSPPKAAARALGSRNGGARRAAYSDVALLLLERIRSDHLATGARLPSERQLAEEFGVSRPTVREALAALGVMGVLETRVGAGTFVVATSGAAEPDSLGASPYDILDARLLVEPGLARLAASRRDRQALSAIKAALQRIEREAEAGMDTVPTESDRTFHLAITRAAANDVLMHVALPLWEAMSETLWRRFKELTWNADQTMRIAIEHRRIYDAIEGRDPDRAAFEMEFHIRRVQSDLCETSEALAPPAQTARSS
jgi:GntR family transcriptional regulator, transcriptional repressor for pyruvate dehydrogenase complex